MRKQCLLLIFTSFLCRFGYFIYYMNSYNYVIVVYIHLKANVDITTGTVENWVMPAVHLSQWTKSCNGWFQSVFYLSCHTCNQSQILCYGWHDYCAVHLVPTYQSILKRSKAEHGVALLWTNDWTSGVFWLQDWDLFKNSCSDLVILTLYLLRRYHFKSAIFSI